MNYRFFSESDISNRFTLKKTCNEKNSLNVTTLIDKIIS